MKISQNYLYIFKKNFFEVFHFLIKRIIFLVEKWGKIAEKNVEKNREKIEKKQKKNRFLFKSSPMKPHEKNLSILLSKMNSKVYIHTKNN